MQGKTSNLSSSYTKSNLLATASYQARLGALLFNLLYACLQSDSVTTTGRQHGLTACQTLQKEEIPKSSFCKCSTS